MLSCISLSLRFNGHFPGEPRLAGVSEAKDDGGGGDNWSYRSCKALVKSSPPTNQHPVFLRTGCPSWRWCHVYVNIFDSVLELFVLSHIVSATVCIRPNGATPLFVTALNRTLTDHCPLTCKVICAWYVTYRYWCGAVTAVYFWYCCRWF